MLSSGLIRSVVVDHKPKIIGFCAYDELDNELVYYDNHLILNGLDVCDYEYASLLMPVMTELIKKIPVDTDGEKNLIF